MAEEHIPGKLYFTENGEPYTYVFEDPKQLMRVGWEDREALSKAFEWSPKAGVTITEKILRQIAPFAPKDVARYVDPLNEAMRAYEINTPQRAAAFLAQLAHESGQFRYVRELWGPTPAQAKYEPPSSKAKELGNTAKGDGLKYRGRGFIQLTGKANYAAVSKALGVDFVAHPELLEQPKYAALSAAWFWHSKGLNELADKGDFAGLTKKINGGLTGFKERQEYWARAKSAMPI